MGCIDLLDGLDLTTVIVYRSPCNNCLLWALVCEKRRYMGKACLGCQDVGSVLLCNWSLFHRLLPWMGGQGQDSSECGSAWVYQRLYGWLITYLKKAIKSWWSSHFSPFKRVGATVDGREHPCWRFFNDIGYMLYRPVAEYIFGLIRLLPDGIAWWIISFLHFSALRTLLILIKSPTL